MTRRENIEGTVWAIFTCIRLFCEMFITWDLFKKSTWVFPKGEDIYYVGRKIKRTDPEIVLDEFEEWD